MRARGSKFGRSVASLCSVPPGAGRAHEREPQGYAGLTSKLRLCYIMVRPRRRAAKADPREKRDHNMGTPCGSLRASWKCHVALPDFVWPHAARLTGLTTLSHVECFAEGKTPRWACKKNVAWQQVSRTTGPNHLQTCNV